MEKQESKSRVEKSIKETIALSLAAASFLSISGCGDVESSRSEEVNATSIETSLPSPESEVAPEPIDIKYNTDGTIDSEYVCNSLSTFVDNWFKAPTKDEVSYYMNTGGIGPDQWSQDFADNKDTLYAPVLFGDDYKTNPDIQSWLTDVNESNAAVAALTLRSSYNDKTEEIDFSSPLFENDWVLSNCSTTDNHDGSVQISSDVFYTTNVDNVTNTDLSSIEDKSGHWDIKSVINENGTLTVTAIEYKE